MSKIAVLGYGVVGSGTVEVFYKNKESLEKKIGKPLDIKYILELRDFPDSPYKDKFTKDFNVILNDDEVDVVAELIGGIKPSYDFVKSCLEKGKNVVTSNKELVAAKGAELLKIAKERNVNFFFEASVGGGIPIIRPLHQCLAANEINGIAGILNGTTNFILTKMISENMSFETALKLAKELGYAESNPSADVDGHDTCRKICILSSLSFGKHIQPENVYTEGISKITIEDVEYAENAGCGIKLIGWSQREEDKIKAMVCPAFIKKESQLCGVNDVFNAILVKGDMTGDVLFYGRGAGKLPTASAVVADIIDTIKLKSTSETLTWSESDENIVINSDDYYNAFYLRVSYPNGFNIKSEINNIFGEVIYLSRKLQPDNETAFITGKMKEADINKALSVLSDEDVCIFNKIRLLDF